MRIVIRLAVVAALALTSTLASHAQCLDYQAQQLSCVGSNNCSQTVAVNEVYPVQYGWYMSYFPVACCDTYYNTNVPETPCDGSTPIRIPKGALAAVASLQPLLIRNCGGGYDPYFDQPTAHFELQRSLNTRKEFTLN